MSRWLGAQKRPEEHFVTKQPVDEKVNHAAGEGFVRAEMADLRRRFERDLPQVPPLPAGGVNPGVGPIF